MARHKKTAAEKRLSGNPGRREIEDDPAIEPITDATPPEDMSDGQKRYWNLYAPYMVKNNLLTDLNKTDLQRLCYFEEQLDNIHTTLSLEGISLLQEKKNYHGDVVDLVEGVYSKLSRNYTATIRVLKSDLRIRTDKLNVVIKKEPKSKFAGLINGGK